MSLHDRSGGLIGLRRCFTSALVSSLAAGYVALASRPARAWNFDEHRSICRVAFQDACALVQAQSVESVVQPEKNARIRRLRVACDSTSIADAFGQACAVSGDLVDNPADLTIPLGNARATNDIHYYTLALLNNVHFQPFSRREWQTRHEAALNAALDTSGDAENEAVRFEKALFLEAFSDHFLEDSFAAGHLGFNRAASSAADAKLFHDQINSIGVWVSAPDKMRWFTLGDGHLAIAPGVKKKLDDKLAKATSKTTRFDEKCGHLDDAAFRSDYGSQIGRLRVECAATRSVQAFIYAFVAGKRHPTLDYYAFLQIPDAKADRSSEQAKSRATTLADTLAAQASKPWSKPPDPAEQLTRSITVENQLTSVNLLDSLPPADAYTSLLYVRRAAHHELDLSVAGRGVAWARSSTWGTRDGAEAALSVFRNTPLEPTYVNLSLGVEVLWLKEGAKAGAYGAAYLRSDVHKSTNGFLRDEIALGGGVSQLSYDRYWLSASYRARLEVGPLIVTPEIGPLLGWLLDSGNRRAVSWGGSAGLSIGGVWKRYGGDPL